MVLLGFGTEAAVPEFCGNWRREMVGEGNLMQYLGFVLS